MNPTVAKAILKELNKRKGLQPNWFTPDFTAQNDFIQDDAKLKAVQCTRRAGKSYGAGLYAFKEAFENPGVSVAIIGLTRDSIKRIFMKDILQTINDQLRLNATPNKSDLTWTLPNGSVIYLLGIDNNTEDMNKLLGQKLKLAIVDEAAFYRIDLEKLVYEILKPAMVDYDGTIALISTTSHLTSSLYYDITNGRKKGWSVHKWTAHDNPFISEAWDKEIELLKENEPGIENVPHFQRMYMNKWVIDQDALVYRYKPGNKLDALPKAKYRYVLGIDLGYNDATAMVVCAYSDHDPNLYIVETFQQSEMIISEVAEKIQELNKKYSFNRMIVDNASKQAVEEMKKRYSLPLMPAEKTGKRDFIELLNADLILNKVKVLPDATEIIDEWSKHCWDERKLAQGKYEEHPSTDNHLSDAFLYAWRWTFQYSSKPKIDKPHPTSEAAVDNFWEDASRSANTNPVPLWEREDEGDEVPHWVSEM